MAKILLFSFFSGCGFLDLGFEWSGFRIGFVNEINPSFMNAYRYARGRMASAGNGYTHEDPEYGYSTCDINDFMDVKRNILGGYIESARSNGYAVGFIGGPPCPDFSIAGKNRGRDGHNGQLSLSYIKLITCMKPDFFLFENVKGLWSTARHREYFEELRKELESAGYVTSSCLKNAMEYGVPQDRNRIFLFGVKKTLNPKRATDGDLDFPWNTGRQYTMDYICGIPWPRREPFITGSLKSKPDGIIDELTVEYWFRKNNVYTHPNASDYFLPRNGLEKMQTVDEGDTGRKSYKRLHRWRYSPTAAYGNNEVHLHPYLARRLSVAEALAIQGLPAGFMLPPDMSLTDKFKTVGNGVPFGLARGLAEGVSELMGSL